MIELDFHDLTILCRVDDAAGDGAAAPQSGEARVDKGPRIVSGYEVTLTLPRAAIDFFHHGWQSWSLACWHAADAVVPVQKPAILHPMQTDPQHARRTDATGAWVGAVRFDDGKVLLLGALGTDARVELRDDTLRGYYETRGTANEWFIAFGAEEEVFAGYADALGVRFGSVKTGPAPRVWCSWYSLYTAITEESLGSLLPGLARFPVDTIQIDDGWQIKVGDWRPNEKFPHGMAALADRIRQTGRRAGLWLAPLIAGRSSALVKEHPDWVLRDERGRPVSAGFNWGEPLYALDTTVPQASRWLGDLMRTVREWGYDYLKLDFLYGGALPGARRDDMAREAAYREALRVIREAAGDAYLVTCGAPVVPSIGLCDALRIGPDVAEFWTSRRDERQLCNPAIPGTRNAIRTTLHRLWLSPVVGVDPDVIYLTSEWNELTAEQRRATQALAHICRFVATSDLPSWLDAGGVTPGELEAAFGDARVVRLGPYRFEVDGETVDFEEVLGLPAPRTPGDRLARAALSWLGNRRVIMRLNDALSRRAAAKRLASVVGKSGA